MWFTLQLLNAIQLFGANLDDYLHLLLPPIVKLFDAPDVPLQARKSVQLICLCAHVIVVFKSQVINGFCWFTCNLVVLTPKSELLIQM